MAWRLRRRRRALRRAGSADDGCCPMCAHRLWRPRRAARTGRATVRSRSERGPPRFEDAGAASSVPPNTSQNVPPPDFDSSEEPQPGEAPDADMTEDAGRAVVSPGQVQELLETRFNNCGASRGHPASRGPAGRAGGNDPWAGLAPSARGGRAVCARGAPLPAGLGGGPFGAPSPRPAVASSSQPRGGRQQGGATPAPG